MAFTKKRWKHLHRIRRNDPERFKKIMKSNAKWWRDENPEFMLWDGAKVRAYKKDLPFDIEEGDIVVPDECPILGIPLTTNTDHIKDNSPTLDRIIPELGYVKGNVWVISARANRIKNDATPEELVRIAEAVMGEVANRGLDKET